MAAVGVNVGVTVKVLDGVTVGVRVGVLVAAGVGVGVVLNATLTPLPPTSLPRVLLPAAASPRYERVILVVDWLHRPPRYPTPLPPVEGHERTSWLPLALRDPSPWYRPLKLRPLLEPIVTATSATLSERFILP